MGLAAMPSIYWKARYKPRRCQAGTADRRGRLSARSHDAKAQTRLWEASERLTGITYHISPASGRRVP